MHFYIFWFCLLSLLLSWIIYPGIISLLASLRKNKPIQKNNTNLSLTIIIAAFNEADKIKSRIENLISLSGEYQFEIIVGSDGSTDNTVQIVESMFLPNVKVLDFKENRGRALVHNDCARKAKGDILFFTDAETIYEKDCLNKIVHHFLSSRIGAVSGRIMYLNEKESNIGQSAGLYWHYEEMIRTSESKLGILGFGTGAVLAIRKKAYQPIGPTEDIDYAGTLEVAAQGYKILYEPGALAYDYISKTSSGALKTRIRQTSRCFKSVFKRIVSKKILLNHPLVFVSALMHKTFRHLTPFFIIGLLLSDLLLLKQGGFYFIMMVMQVAFYGLALAGFLNEQLKIGKKNWLISLPYNFVLLNIGRGVGVYKAFFRKEQATYKTEL